jgi:hypothetical protein
VSALDARVRRGGEQTCDGSAVTEARCRTAGICCTVLSLFSLKLLPLSPERKEATVTQGSSHWKTRGDGVEVEKEQSFGGHCPANSISPWAC